MPTPMKSMFNNLPSPFSAAAAAAVVEEEGSAASSTTTNNGGGGGEEVWICSCAKQWPMTQKRCGNTQCCKWRGGKQDDVGHHRSDASSSSTNKTKGQQSNGSTENVTTSNNDDGDWTCHNCQHTMAAKKQRCGKCSHWKGGKRTLFKKKTDGTTATAATSSVASAANDATTDVTVHKVNNYPFDITQEWTCNNCSITLPGKQTRCGKCHAWRSGKRQGGWKLKFKSNDEDDEDDGIDRTVEWTCCNVVLPARQTRCGKCHKWRGGKRVFAGKNGGGNESSKKKKRVKSESDKKTVKMVTNDQLKENDQVEVPGMPSVHSPAVALANDTSSNNKGNIVFEYPIPSISAVAVAAAPMYHPLPSIASESYCPLPSPIASCAALVTNSAETAEI